MSVTEEPDYKLDFRSAFGPLTLLKASRTFKQMESDEVLEILARDPDTRTDLFKILPKDRFQLVEKQVMHDSQLYYRILLKKVRPIS